MAEKRKLVRNTTRDVSRLVAVASVADFKLTVVDAQWVWEHHSRTTSASDWADLANYSDETLLEILKLHLLDEPNA